MKIDKNTKFWFVTDPYVSGVESELVDVVSEGTLDYLYNVMVGGYMNRTGAGPRKPSDENLTIYDNKADAEKDGQVRMERHNKKLAKADNLLTAAVTLLEKGEDDLAKEVLSLLEEEPMPIPPGSDEAVEPAAQEEVLAPPEDSTTISDEVTCKELLNAQFLKKLLDSIVKHVEDVPADYGKAETLFDTITKQVRRFFVKDKTTAAVEDETESAKGDEQRYLNYFAGSSAKTQKLLVAIIEHVNGLPSDAQSADKLMESVKKLLHQWLTKHGRFDIV